jgi:hypothetical protein
MAFVITLLFGIIIGANLEEYRNKRIEKYNNFVKVNEEIIKDEWIYP